MLIAIIAGNIFPPPLFGVGQGGGSASPTTGGMPYEYNNNIVLVWRRSRSILWHTLFNPVRVVIQFPDTVVWCLPRQGFSVTNHNCTRLNKHHPCISPPPPSPPPLFGVGQGRGSASPTTGGYFMNIPTTLYWFGVGLRAPCGIRCSTPLGL